jgi:hypothetical protein
MPKPIRTHRSLAFVQLNAPTYSRLQWLRSATLWTFVVAVAGLVLQFFIMSVNRADTYRLASIDKRLQVAQYAYSALIKFKRQIASPTAFSENGQKLDKFYVDHGLYLEDSARHHLIGAASAVRQSEIYRSQGNTIEQAKWFHRAGEEADRTIVALVVSMRLTPTPEESSDGVNY